MGRPVYIFCISVTNNPVWFCGLTKIFYPHYQPVKFKFKMVHVELNIYLADTAEEKANSSSASQGGQSTSIYRPSYTTRVGDCLKKLSNRTLFQKFSSRITEKKQKKKILGS